MWIKIMAGASLVAVLGFGAALVSNADSPVVTHSSSGASAAGGDSDARVEVISHGHAIDVSQHVDPDGAYTVFLFGADW